MTVDSGTLALSGAAIVTGSTTVNTGTLLVTGSLNSMGGTTLNGGWLQIGDGTTAGSLSGDVSDNGTLIFDNSTSTTYAGSISGTGFLVQECGTLNLTGFNTYSGDTMIWANSTVQVSSDNSLGVGTVNDDGTLAFIGSGPVDSCNPICGGGGVTVSGPGAVELANTVTYSGPTTVSANSTLQIFLSNSVGSDLTGTIYDYGSLILRSVESDPQTFSTTITGGGGLTLACGTVTLTGSNDIGNTSIGTGGTLQISNSQALGTADNLDLVGGTLDLNGYSISVETLNGSGTIDNLAGEYIPAAGYTLADGSTLHADGDERRRL